MKSPAVIIVYHFFAHYRKAVVEELIRSPEHVYLFAGDVRDTMNSGIAPMIFEDANRFISTKSHFLRRRYLIQSNVIGLALRRDITTIIYLGDAQFLTTWISAALARLCGKRVLFWSHGWIRPESGWRDRVRRAFYGLSHGMMLYGHRAREIGIHKGFRPENLYVIYNSLDYEAQRFQREIITPESSEQTKIELFANPTWPMVICSGRLVAERKIDYLLYAAAKLAEEGYFLNIVIIGEGPQRTTWQVLAEQLRLPVRFYGACYDEAVLARLYCAANVTVIPAYAGLAVIQSLGFGTPVITHSDLSQQGPEVEAILPDVTGDLYKWGDVDDLAIAIRKWTIPKSDIVSRQCYRMVELFYHPQVQCRNIDFAVTGQPFEPDSWINRAELVTRLE